MQLKLLLRWMPDRDPRHDVLKVYRIERNRLGVLVYRIVEVVVSTKDRRELSDPNLYARGTACSQHRMPCVGDLRRAASLHNDTPEGIVRDWWDEHVPVTGDQWRRAERRKAKLK